MKILLLFNKLINQIDRLLLLFNLFRFTSTGQDREQQMVEAGADQIISMGVLLILNYLSEVFPFPSSTFSRKIIELKRYHMYGGKNQEPAAC